MSGCPGVGQESEAADAAGGELPGRGATSDVIRVALCDDHAVVRSGLRRIVADEPDLDVVGEAGAAEEAVAVARAERPDVFVMDLGLPGTSGMEATRRVVEVSPQTKVLVLTVHDDVAYLRKAFDAGAQPQGPDPVGAVGFRSDHDHPTSGQGHECGLAASGEVDRVDHNQIGMNPSDRIAEELATVRFGDSPAAVLGGKQLAGPPPHHRVADGDQHGRVPVTHRARRSDGSGRVEGHGAPPSPRV